MIVKRLLGAALLLLSLAGLMANTPVVHAAEVGVAALAQIPGDAPIVIQIHGIERTKDRLLTMLKTALPDQQPVIKDAIENLLKALPEGRKLNGLDKSAPIFIVLTEMPDPAQGLPKLAIFVGVTKYQDFRDGVLLDEERKDLKPNKDGYEVTAVNNIPVYFTDRSKDGYAIVTPDKDLAAKLAKKPEKGLDKKVSADLAKRMTDADLAVFVDMAAINKKYGDALKDMKKAAEDAIENGPGTDKATQDLAKKMIAPMFQAVGDSEAFLTTLEFRPEGLNWALHGEVGAKTKTNELLKDSKPGAIAELEKLPAGQMMYMGVQIRPALLKEFGVFVFGALAAGDKKDDPSLKAMKEAMEALAAAKPTLQVSSSDVPPRGLSVMTVEDPAKAVEASLKMYASIKGDSTFGTTPIKGTVTIKPKAEKYQGFELNFVSMTYDMEKLAEQQAANPAFANKEKAIEYVKSVMGEGQNLWFGTDGKVMISVVAKDVTDAKKLIDAFVKGGNQVGALQAFKDTRKQMPADTTVLALIDLPQYAETVAKVMKPLLDGMGLNLPPNFGTPAVKGQTSYLGLSVTTQPQKASMDLFIPAKGINEVYKMYFKGLLGGGQ